MKLRHIFLLTAGACMMGTLFAQTPAESREQTLAPERHEIRVQLRAREATQISAGMSARILNLPVREGDTFAAKSPLISFDCRLEEAELKSAQAEKRNASAAVRANQSLNKLQAVSQLEYESSLARLDMAQARIEMSQARLSACQEVAPWSGRVVKLYVSRHQRVRLGDPLIDIINPSVLEVDMRVPSHWVRWIKTGERFQIHIDETAQTIDATVSAVGAQIDPVSQTIAVTGEIVAGDNALILPGMSGLAHFRTRGTP